MKESLLNAIVQRPAIEHQQSRQRPQPTAAAQPAAESPDEIRLQKACSEFESVFIAYLLKEMRATVDKSGLTGGGRSEELYESIMDAEIARNLSAAGGLGLARMLYDQLAARSGGQNAGSGEPAEKPQAAGLMPVRKIR